MARNIKIRDEVIEVEEIQDMNPDWGAGPSFAHLLHDKIKASEWQDNCLALMSGHSEDYYKKKYQKEGHSSDRLFVYRTSRPCFQYKGE